MNFIQTKINTIRQKLDEKGLTDPRLFGLVLLAVIGLIVLWSGAGVVQKNYELLQKIAVIEEENRILELKNRNREIQIEYFKTPEFAELKARRVNGKAAPGEKVYIVTEEAALSALKTPEEVPEIESNISDKPQYQQNFEAWMDFFFGNST